MNRQEGFHEVFEVLRGMLKNYSANLICEKDKHQDYCLNTKHVIKNKKSLFFGAVQIKKNYVSYHLMLVYVFPELLTNISTELKQRMQGKSCFNFKRVDSKLFEELADLTKAGYKKFESAGYI